MFLESLDNIFKDSKENVYADFAMRNLRRYACLMEERKQLGPCADGDFDGGNGGDDTSS
jgi:hypothetical protein